MDVAQQRDIDIDRPRPSAQRWQNLRGVFDNESLTKLLGAYRMESLLELYCKRSYISINVYSLIILVLLYYIFNHM